MPAPAPRHADRDLPSSTVVFLFACFFVSGATALIYEIVWLRMLSLAFGETGYTVVIVLATFMGGLALGSLWVSRRAPGSGDPLRAYGWVEIGVGLSAAATPIGLALLTSASASLRDLALPGRLVEGVLASFVLLVPTALMGATLPLLSQAVSRGVAPATRPVGALYAVNAWGAVVGAVAAGYGLLPAVGNRLTLASAAGANLVIGLVVLAVRYGAPLDARAVQVPSMRGRGSAADRAPARLVLVALGVAGATTMMSEVAWTRALALVIGSSTYAFTAMLVAFLTGIAAGSALYVWLLGPRAGTPLVFAAAQAVVGVAGVISLAFYERMPTLLLTALSSSQSAPFVLSVELAIASMALLPSTLAAGAVFPCALSIVAPRARPAQDVGRLYAANTVGAVAGAAAGGLIMVPAFGVHATLKAGIIVNLVLAAVVLGAATPAAAVGRRWAAAGVAAVAALGTALMPAWDVRILSSGPAIYADAYREAASARRLDDVLRANHIVFYRDGVTSSVAVGRDADTTYLRINGKTDASTGVDMATQMMCGHLPLLFHADPRRILVIGLGGGITAGAVAAHPFERLDIVEIEPAVIEAARFFADVQSNVLRDGRVRLIVDDARRFVRTTAERYDVIVSEPSNPWVAGVSALFTVEFFGRARQRLAPGGVMVQWIHAYNLFPDDFRMVVKTFREAFPSTTVWEPAPGDFLLLGRTDPAPLDVEHLRTRFAANATLRRDLLRLGIEAWPGVLALLALGEAETARFAEPARLNTDDRLPLEFSAPRALYADTRMNLALIRASRNASQPSLAGVVGLDEPETQYWIGKTHLNRSLFPDALVHFERALTRDPSYGPAIRGRAMAQALSAGGAARLEPPRQ